MAWLLDLKDSLTRVFCDTTLLALPDGRSHLGLRITHPELAGGDQHHLGAVVALHDLRRAKRIDFNRDLRTPVRRYLHLALPVLVPGLARLDAVAAHNKVVHKQSPA